MSRTTTAERNPATAHLFIINPLSGERMDNLFSTHPATENRIAALNELARELGGGLGSTAAATRRGRPVTHGAMPVEMPAAAAAARGDKLTERLGA